MSKTDKSYVELKQEYDEAKQDLKNALLKLFTTTPFLEYVLIFLLIIIILAYIM